MNRPAIALFFVTLGYYFSNGRALPEVDCIAAPYVAWSMCHGTYDLRICPELRPHATPGGYINELPDGRWVSMRTPGSAIAIIPYALPLTLLRDHPPGDQAMQQLGKLSGAVCVAEATVLFLLICQRWTPRAAWPATILFGFGTCAYSVASQASWMHGPALLGITAGLYCQLRPQPHLWYWQWLSGLAFGFAVLTRPTTAFFVIATLVVMLFQRRWRDLFWLSLGGLLPAVVLFHYNWTNFGSPFLGGYADNNWSITPPFHIGFFGLLVAPSRGVFVYSPALVLMPMGLWGLWKRRDLPGVILSTWSIAGFVTLLFFARWYDWRGGWCYGPRFLIETMPIACLLVALSFERLSRIGRCFTWTLIGISVMIHAIGVFGYRGYAGWQQRHDPSVRDDFGACLFEFRDTQIEAHIRGMWEQLTEG